MGPSEAYRGHTCFKAHRGYKTHVYKNTSRTRPPIPSEQNWVTIFVAQVTALIGISKHCSFNFSRITTAVNLR